MEHEKTPEDITTVFHFDLSTNQKSINVKSFQMHEKI